MPVVVVREESRSYPESTERLMGQIGDLTNHQTALPRIARDVKLTALIEKAVQELPTEHDIYRHDARDLSMLKPESVHLGCHLVTRHVLVPGKRFICVVDDEEERNITRDSRYCRILCGADEP